VPSAAIARLATIRRVNNRRAGWLLPALFAAIQAPAPTLRGRATVFRSPSRLIDAKIRELDDWRDRTLSHVRALIKQAAPEVVEEWK